MYTTSSGSYGAHYARGSRASALGDASEAGDADSCKSVPKLCIKDHIAWGAQPLQAFCSPRPDDLIVPETKKKTERDILSENLEKYGFVETKVSADGNCQFRSLAWYLYGTDAKHQVVRRQVAKHMREHSTLYRDFVEGEEVGFQHFVERMSNENEWGDHLTLQAAADTFNYQIKIVTSHVDSGEGKQNGGSILVIKPRDAEGNVTQASKEVWLSFCEEAGAEHYNPVCKRRSASTPRP
ncbi:hypothetical protein DIPPA_22758 [Diplonema papillatum]|nr:hypothetical protein DIPPA_22758 [Diplonema papillatum]